MFQNRARADAESTDESILTDRRAYLKAAGATAISVPLLAGVGAAATERHGIRFDNVVDMVDDAGCDPNGNEPCDDKLQSVAGSNTLLKFPSGTYQFTEENILNGYSNFGIVGEGDVVFTVPDDFAEEVINVNYGTGVLIENITIDQSNATPTVQVAPDDGLEVHGLEMIGQGISSVTGDDPGNGEAPNAFNPMVRSSGGEGMIENITLHNEGRMGAYSRTGIWIGETNKGTIILRNCNVEGFSGNGVYASRTPGVVQVEGGVYKNNDLSQVRIGSSGSYVDGATAETDLSESRSPNPSEMLNGSGIRLESDRGGSGAEIRNCDIRIGSEVNAGGGIQVFSNYGAFTVENTRVKCNSDKTYAIRAQSPDNSGDTRGKFQDVSVTGDAAGRIGILIEDRPDTIIENCCIQQTGSSRIGIALDDCDGSQVADCTINAGAQALRLRDTNATVTGIDESGTCPAPSLSSSDDTSGSSSNSSNGSSDSSSSEGDSSDSSSSNANLVVMDDDSSDGRSHYEITASDGVKKTGFGGATRDGNDDISGSTVSGGVNGWRDSYEYEGELVVFEVSDYGASIKLNASEQTITVLGTEEGDTSYSLEVSGTLEHADDSNDPISEAGSSVEGGVGTFRDVYNYSGELVEASIEDTVSITTSPESR
jgi:hypothetical protein